VDRLCHCSFWDTSDEKCDNKVLSDWNRFHHLSTFQISSFEWQDDLHFPHLLDWSLLMTVFKISSILYQEILSIWDSYFEPLPRCPHQIEPLGTSFSSLSLSYLWCDTPPFDWHEMMYLWQHLTTVKPRVRFPQMNHLNPVSHCWSVPPKVGRRCNTLVRSDWISFFDNFWQSL